jgi:hypothetical protein
MERRRLMFMGLASALTATLGLAATAQAGILGDTTGLARGPTPSAEAEALASRQGAEDEASEGRRPARPVQQLRPLSPRPPLLERDPQCPLPRPLGPGALPPGVAARLPLSRKGAMPGSPALHPPHALPT